MSVYFRCLFNDIVFNSDVTPVWAEAIKRWSQLDRASQVLAEATSRIKDTLKSPEEVVLMSSQGSSLTDYNFAHAGKVSPSLFVHTLPNVRSLTFSSLTAYEGPVFCFSQGKSSLVKFLKELSYVPPGKRTLIINLNRNGDEYQCDFWECGIDKSEATHVMERLTGHLFTTQKLDDFQFREELLRIKYSVIDTDLTIRKVK